MRLIDFLTLNDLDFEGKTVLARVDFNSPIDVETKEITDDTRIRRHAQTIRELMDKGGKVVVMAHQGRPGKGDFTTMKKHAEKLSTILGRHVGYVDDLYGERAKSAILKLKKGQALVLENVRFFTDEMITKTPEEHAKSELITNLAPLVDIYVGDGFAVAHRAHASIVGFPVIMQAVAGRIMERELTALERVIKAEERPSLYLIGGAKADDAEAVSNYVLGKGTADYVLTSGVIAHLFLHAQGVNIGKVNLAFLKKNDLLGYVPKIVKLFKDYGEKILLPEDFGLDVNGKRVEIDTVNLPTNYPLLDIGPKTVENYSNLIRDARNIVLSGPMGVYERDEFMLGTRGILKAVANSDAFSVAGGGNTIEAIKKLGLSEKISYISTGGGALMEFITGKKLPGIEALKRMRQS